MNTLIRFTVLVAASLAGAHCPMARAQAPANSHSSQPTAANLAAREAFQDDKFGIFIHWGVYSVLGRGEWVMNNEKISVEDYEPLAEQFNPVEFDADEWCQLFKQAGARYVTITSKHHDGFAMWDTDQSDWDIVDRTPYGKDVLKQLAEACERHDLKLYFYHSQLDWHHPDYYPRGSTGKAAGRPESGDFEKYIDFMNAQLSELLDGDYGKVAGIWFDGWWDQQSKRFEATRDAPVRQTQVDWRLEDTYSLIHQLQPACLVGANHHVAPFEGEDFQMFERDLPGQNKGGHSKDATIGSLPLETCDTINTSWGYNASDDKFKSPHDLIHYLARAAGNNANLLLNIGPKPDGTIDEQSAERLRAIGDWLETYGTTIYGTRGGPVKPQAWGVSTQTADKVYLHVLEIPSADQDHYVTLTGTEALNVDSLSRFGTQEEVAVRKLDSGEWQVRLPEPIRSATDTILVVDRRK
jgi:alpha-L-fucosidase